MGEGQVLHDYNFTFYLLLLLGKICQDLSSTYLLEEMHLFSYINYLKITSPAKIIASKGKDVIPSGAIKIWLIMFL